MGARTTSRSVGATMFPGRSNAYAGSGGLTIRGAGEARPAHPNIAALDATGPGLVVNSQEETEMARLLLGNVEDGISDEEIGEFLSKYGFPTFSRIEHMLGDGSRPAALVHFEKVEPEALRKPKERVHNLYWKKGLVSAQILRDDFA